MTDGLVQREPAMPADRDYGAKVFVSVDILLHHLHQVLEPRSIHCARVWLPDRAFHLAFPWSLAT